jgi:hypothetical protein
MQLELQLSITLFTFIVKGMRVPSLRDSCRREISLHIQANTVSRNKYTVALDTLLGNDHEIISYTTAPAER